MQVNMMNTMSRWQDAWRWGVNASSMPDKHRPGQFLCEQAPIVSLFMFLQHIGNCSKFCTAATSSGCVSDQAICPIPNRTQTWQGRVRAEGLSEIILSQACAFHCRAPSCAAHWTCPLPRRRAGQARTNASIVMHKITALMSTPKKGHAFPRARPTSHD